ncbi:hypothetical protein ACFL27_23250, partial [candidate division CSSED10-310 bacterium]
FPHQMPQHICQTILKYHLEIPSWPQLPNRSPLENMYTQYSERLPALVFNEEKQNIYFDTSQDIYAALEEFYGHYLESDVEYFRMSSDYAQGFYSFREEIQKSPLNGVKFLKGQITGPISFGLTITDENKRAILYHDELFDAVMKNCIMKVKWQIKMLQKLHPAVIIMIDEPYLSAFGSGYISLSREQVVGHIGAIVETIKEEGATPGIHCCGNTDWSIVIDTGTQILNFDADSYFQGITLYPEKLGEFLHQEGILAWGIIPTTDKIGAVKLEDILSDFDTKLTQLVRKGFTSTALLQRSIITPSCGLGTHEEVNSEKAIQLAALVAAALREKYLAHGS